MLDWVRDEFEPGSFGHRHPAVILLAWWALTVVACALWLPFKVVQAAVSLHVLAARGYWVRIGWWY